MNINSKALLVVQGDVYCNKLINTHGEIIENADLTKFPSYGTTMFHSDLICNKLTVGGLLVISGTLKVNK